MASHKKCYQENNNHNFILRPSLPPSFPARKKKINIFYCFILSQSTRRKAIDRVLKIFPIMCELPFAGPLASLSELAPIFMRGVSQYLFGISVLGYSAWVSG